MDKFIVFRDKLIENFNKLSRTSDYLFEVGLDKDELWETYLSSFPDGTNPVFRERTVHDCSCCRHFIKSIGGAVFIENNKLKTIWDFDTTTNDEYQVVADALSRFVKGYTVKDKYVTKEKNIGCKSNFEDDVEFSHFYLNLPDKFVYNGRDTIDTVKGEARTTKEVFKRSLEELTESSISVVLELINQNSLYRGTEWKAQLEKFLKLKKDYSKLSEEEKDNYCWVKSLEVGNAIARIRNHSIGVLLIDISNDVDLDTAVRRYEQVVAPTNYKRSKPIYSKKMLEDAKNKLSELGYLDSLKRRFATLDDITVNNILFANRDVYSKLLDDDIFGELEKEIPVDAKKYSKIEELSVYDFVNNVLTSARELEVLFDGKLTGNLCSLIAPVNKESKTMFKWNNNFSWAYTGNITDSMKQRVKEFGGKVDGDLRFSIQWNEDGKDDCDLDAHCIEPDNYEIYFSNKRQLSPNKGMLDVDIISPDGDIAVENITYENRKLMKPGVYKFFVHQYSGSAKNGFRAEVEFDGKVYSFDYSKSIKGGEKVYVADVILDSKGNFSIKEKISSSVSSKEIWSIKTNQFIPVQTVMYSPNYWDEQVGVGNKHLFFMLKDCVNPENPNGFYNEFLNNELNEHRKVMEALGEKLSVVSAQDQLSGLGFSLTQRNELVVKVKGKVERLVKIKF